MDVHKMLEQVKAGQLDIAEAEEKLKDLPYEDLGYAKLDLHRKLRSGFPETVFCQGKPDEFLAEIFKKLYQENGEVFGTRASKEQYELVKKAVPTLPPYSKAWASQLSSNSEQETADWMRSRLHRRNGRYSRGGGGCQDGGIFRLPHRTDLRCGGGWNPPPAGPERAACKG